MPRQGPPARKKRPQTITVAQRFHLLRGYDYFDEFPFESEAQRRQLWFRHRSELMTREASSEEETGTYENPLYPPGSKPSAFDDYESQDGAA